MWDTTFTNLFDRGGPVMWPLLIGSIIGLAIILERLFFFYRHRTNKRSTRLSIKQYIRSGDLAKAIALAGSSRSATAHITKTYLENVNCSDALRQDILRREGSRCMEEAETHLRGLSLIAHLSPLLGLLGTVTGLVSSFHVIEKLDGMAQPAQLASGIWESLLTTVFGLVIAIPCLAAYHTFEQHADRIARRMQFAISELNEWFGKKDDVPMVKPNAGDEDFITVHS